MSTRKKQLRNNVALVLDDSGSMNTFSREAQVTFNKWIDDVKAKAIEHSQATNVSIVYFGQRTEVKIAHQSSKRIQHIEHYNPMQGRTALFEGVELAIKTLDEVVPLKKYDDSFLVLVVTDGGENVSSHARIETIVNHIKQKQGEGHWTFVFMLPPGARNSFCRSYSIPTDNAIEWEGTAAGIERVCKSTSMGLSSYYGARASGSRSVSNFFVTTDLSQVTPSQVKRKLHDVSGACKAFTVPKEEVIRDFVEKKTKRPYVIGHTYYQLMKPEKVQASKDVLIVEKGKPQIWCGTQARQMIGLPAGVDAKVDPGNHANYDVYVQSTSVNRKLPRGTKIIVMD